MNGAVGGVLSLVFTLLRGVIGIAGPLIALVISEIVSRGAAGAGQQNAPGAAAHHEAPAETGSVSVDEQEAILRMLAEKKITVAQAEQLLSALQGGR
jgi:hypothetical protein